MVLLYSFETIPGISRVFDACSSALGVVTATSFTV